MVLSTVCLFCIFKSGCIIYGRFWNMLEAMLRGKHSFQCKLVRKRQWSLRILCPGSLCRTEGLAFNNTMPMVFTCIAFFARFAWVGLSWIGLGWLRLAWLVLPCRLGLGWLGFFRLDLGWVGLDWIGSVQLMWPWFASAWIGLVWLALAGFCVRSLSWF